MDTYAHPEVLIETEWLAANLTDPDLAVVEVDEDTTAYTSGHIPGAVSLDWLRELRDTPRREFISSVQMADLLGQKGISADQTVVLYGGNNNWFATYAYWLMKMRGVKNLRLLNGGRKKWELEERAMTAEVPDRMRATFRIGKPEPGIRILRDEIVALIPNGKQALIDVRSPEEFRGELLAPPHLPQEQAQVPGHIPGAKNIPWAKAANPDGTFKTATELTELYQGEGMTPGKDIVAYCRIGERSSHTWFVLTQLLGYPQVRNYDGSWTEYGSLVGVQVER